VGVRKWGSPIDLSCRPYNRSALPCCLWSATQSLLEVKINLKFWNTGITSGAFMYFYR